MNAQLHPPPVLAGGLTTAQAERLRAQFARLAADADGFAEDFYDRLFAIAPLVRAMFRGPMPEQRAKLMRMLGLLVQRLDAPGELAQALSGLGERHRAYGVLASDFEPVGRALLGTLGARLGPDFDTPARMAWQQVYGFVVEQMSAGEAFADA